MKAIHIQATALLATVLVGSLYLSGCAKTGAVTELEKVEKGLTAFETVRIETAAKTPDLQPYAKQLAPIAVERVKAAKLFKNVGDSTTKGDLVLKLNVEKRQAGDKAKRLLNMGGEAEVNVQAQLEDTKQKKSLGIITIVGSSKHTSTWSVGGYSSKFHEAGDNLDERALIAVSDALVDFLKEKK